MTAQDHTPDLAGSVCIWSPPPDGLIKNNSTVEMVDLSDKLQKFKSGISSTMVKAMISDVLEDDESETKQSSSIFTAMFREKMEWNHEGGGSNISGN